MPNPSPAINAAPINFYTSVLGNLDYTYGLDTVLVNSDPIVTVFADNLPNNLLPSDLAGNFLLDHFISSTGFVPNVGWTADNSIADLLSADCVEVNVKDILANIFTGVTVGAASLTGNLSGNIPNNYIWFVCYPTGPVANLIKYSGSPLIGVDNTAFIVNGVNRTNHNGLNRLYLVFVDFTDAFVSVIELNTHGFNNGIASGAVANSNTLTLLNGSNTCYIVELLSYFTLTNFQGVYNYFYGKYNGFTLPFTFPANAVPQHN